MVTGFKAQMMTHVLKGCGFFAEFSICISAGFFNLLDYAFTSHGVQYERSDDRVYSCFNFCCFGEMMVLEDSGSQTHKCSAIIDTV